VQGSQQFFLEYDQLPDYENDTGSTPFINPGSTHLLLPEGYTQDNLNSYLLPFDQETERKRLGVGVKLHLKSRWELTGKVSKETKEGTDWIGAAMGPTTPDNIFKFTNGALLPEPIDYETNKIDARLSYHGQKTQLEFAYNGSLFYNQDTSLRWTDPLTDPNPKAGPDVYRPGQISLEPDNQMHQLSALLGHQLSPTNRITALLSASQLTQDQQFLPYSVYDTVDSLPKQSLDGEVWLYRGKFKLTSQPMNKLRLSGQYSYDERDNRTDSTAYTYILADGVPGEDVINPRANDPLSYRRQKIDLSANYRINSMMSLLGGYEYHHIHRDHDDNQRKTTRENTFSAKFKVRPVAEFNVDLYGEIGRRNGSTYRTRAFENPKLRVPYLADMDREMLGVRFNYMPIDRLSLGLTTEYQQEDYTESELGLREADQTSALLNANYQFSEKINTYAFFSYERFTSNTAGENKEVEKGTFDAWEGDLKDRINSFGLGLEINEFADKWNAGVDWVYTRGRGNIDMTGFTAKVDQTTGEIISELVPIDPTEQFSDVKTNLSSIQLWTEYRHSEKISYRLSYWYEHYEVEDWADDGTVNNYYPLEADSITQYLLLGEDSPEYDQHVVGVSMKVRF
jgi:MtrB/PioB family decaheme-associated outer membrane protein